MTLKRKIASILLLIMVVSSLVYLAVFKLIVFKGFEDAEISDAVHDMNQCISFLNLEIRHFDSFVHDWSSWDSACNFITDSNQEFIDENLGIDVYLDQSISLMHFYNSDGRLVWGKTYDLGTEEEIPLDLSKELNAGIFYKLITQENPESYTSGIIQTSMGTMIIASHPILTSENEGPSNGALIMGKLFTEDSIASLSGQLGIQLDAWPVTGEQIPEAVRALMPLLIDSDSVRLINASSDILHAYSIVRDIEDQPAIILEASFPRLITQKGTKAYIVGMMILMGAGLLVFVSISWIFVVYVLNPIARLTENALEIGVSSNILENFDTNRPDEIGVLSREFAAMVERLSSSEKRYRLLAENARDVIWVFDLDLGYTYVSPSVMQLRGYTAQEALKQSLDEILTPESCNLVNEIIEREISLELNGHYHGPEWSYTEELEMIRKDGSTVWTEVVFNILYDEQLNPKGLMGITRDITERKWAEQALKESEENYRQLFNRSPAAIYRIDFETGKFVKANDVFCEYLGCTQEELSSFNPYDILTEDSRKLFLERMEKFALGMEVPETVELEIVSKTGKIWHVELHNRFVYDEQGHVVASDVVATDLPERRRAEDALLASEERFKSIVSTSQEWIWGIDTAGIHTFSNPAVEDILGYHPDEIIGHPVINSMIHEEDLPKVTELLDKSIKRKTGWMQTVFRWKHRDGTWRYLESSAVPILDSSGVLQGFQGSDRDITLRQQVEEAIRKSEEKYRQLAETAHDFIVTVDLDFNITYANKAVLNLSEGIDPLGKSLLDFTPPHLHQVQEEMMQKRREGFSDMLAFEWDLIDSNGKTKTFDIRATLLADDGKPSGVMFIARDITERQQAEEAIRKSEERYRTIFESTATANVIITEDSTILMANNDFAGLSGYAKDELEGKMNWTGFVHKDDLERMKNYHKMRMLDPESAPSSYEFRSINRKGEVRDLIMKVAVIPETKDSIASMIDITDWKHSEQARFESEARFQQLAELLPETVYEADESGVFTFVNQTGFEKFGYTQEDLTRGMTVFDMIIPADHAQMIATYQRLIKGEHVGLGEYTAIKKDGTTFPALVNSTAIYHDGKPVGHRGFVIDISEKKKLENQLARAQKMEAIGTLAGGIAHDFNNLLMGILGNISLVLFQIDQKNPIYDRLRNVEGYVQRGSDLTKQLLGFARGGKYEVRPTHLGEFIKESSELFGRTNKEISIHHKTQEDLWTVEVDRGQMEQVFMNLYVNAWHAMPHGGDLYLSEENVHLDSVTLKPYEIAPGKFVKVTVTDNGTGMDEITKSRIFEPFFTTKEQGRGTGLGLASAYGIIKNHGGFINVQSEKNIGTSFMIYLPASDKDVDYDQKVEEELYKGRETVLLIDDEEMILEVSSKMLEELGYQVIVASGGKIGVQTYEQNKDIIELVILDMVMPDFGGKESFDTLISINPSVKVLLSSGYSLDSQAKEIMARGCKGFIQKPFTMTDLSMRIREIIDRQ